jgi:hypothetical protein
VTCRNCAIEIYLDLCADPAEPDWTWKHVQPEGACGTPEPRSAGPGEL